MFRITAAVIAALGMLATASTAEAAPEKYWFSATGPADLVLPWSGDPLLPILAHPSTRLSLIGAGNRAVRFAIRVTHAGKDAERLTSRFVWRVPCGALRDDTIGGLLGNLLGRMAQQVPTGNLAALSKGWQACFEMQPADYIPQRPPYRGFYVAHLPEGEDDAFLAREARIDTYVETILSGMHRARLELDRGTSGEPATPLTLAGKR